MSDIVFGGWSDTWRTDLGYASVRSPDIRPPPQTISYTEQSNSETRKTAFCSSETLKLDAGDGPAAAGCPVSNPDNNGACAHYVMVSKFQWKPFWLVTQ